MQYRTLPHGGENISEIGLGLGIVSPEDKPERLLEGALEAGINFYDLCAAYEPVYEAIKPTLARNRSKVFTQMHLGATYRDGNYAFSRNLEKVRATFEQKLELCALGYTDFLILHCIDEKKDLQLVLDKGIYQYALECKEQGIASHLGFSTHNPEIARELLNLGGFDLFMFSLNAAFDFRQDGELALGETAAREEIYQLAARQGVGISAMKPFAGGQLLNKKLSPLGVALSVPQCLRYVLDRPAVMTCVCGATRPTDLQDYISLFDPHTDSDYATALSGASVVGSLRRCIYCNHCAPCPRKLNVGLINKYYDLSRLGDDLARQHYLNLEHHASECNDCGHCDKRCPFKTAQMERMHEIANYFGI